MPDDVMMRAGVPPSAFTRWICELPSFVSVTRRRRPSGDHAGELLLPRKFATATRWPVPNDCTYTTGFLFSNETYARRVPSGDHFGESNGSFDVTIVCGSAPSASATSNW